MADDRTKRAPQDAKLISLVKNYEVEYRVVIQASLCPRGRAAALPASRPPPLPDAGIVSGAPLRFLSNILAIPLGVEERRHK